MKTLERFISWFDQAHEQAGWMLILWGMALLSLCVLALWQSVLVPWQVFAVIGGIVALGVLMLLGTRYFNGVELGRGGFRVSNRSQEDSSEESVG
jgi:hypothetical protein